MAQTETIVLDIAVNYDKAMEVMRRFEADMARVSAAARVTAEDMDRMAASIAKLGEQRRSDTRISR